MQKEKTKDADAAAIREAQAAQANLCRTTVIADAFGGPDRTRQMVSYVKGLGHRGRFDLLTVLQPSRLLQDPELFDQVASDAALAIKLHHGEKLVVACEGAGPIVEALRARPEFRQGVDVDALDLAPASSRRQPTPRTLAVTCMDFRQHDSDLPERLRDAFGLREPPAILAMAGGAKDAVDATPRGRRIIERIAAFQDDPHVRGAALGFDRIVLTCHTDCGAMGGDAAPVFCDAKGLPNAGRQLKVLRERLKAAALSFRLAFPRMRISTGIVRLKDGRIDEVIPTRP